MNILFVCTANVSRSFLAEQLAKHEIEERRLNHVCVSSAGLFAFSGSQPDPQMVAYLSQMGIDGVHHASRQMTIEEANWADIIFVMEKAHWMHIKTLWPSVSTKTELLSRCISASQKADDVIDPFGRSSYHYRLVQSLIALAVKHLANILQSVEGECGDIKEAIFNRLRGE